jgi:hypothetical protein
MSLLQPPENTKVYETSNSRYWFEEDVLYVISKKGRPDPKVEAQELSDFKKLLGGKKVYGIMDVSEASSESKESRERNTRELPLLFHAIAFIVKNPVTRMLAHLYLGIKPLQFPVKMCSSKKEAQEWIKSLRKI